MVGFQVEGYLDDTQTVKTKIKGVSAIRWWGGEEEGLCKNRTGTGSVPEVEQ